MWMELNKSVGLATNTHPESEHPREERGAEPDYGRAPPGFPNRFNTGIFLTFPGQFSRGGTSNEENTLVYAGPATSNYFHLIEGRQVGIGHLDGIVWHNCRKFPRRPTDQRANRRRLESGLPAHG